MSPEEPETIASQNVRFINSWALFGWTI